MSKKEALAILPSHSNGFRDLCFSLEELTVDHFQKAGDKHSHPKTTIIPAQEGEHVA